MTEAGMCSAVWSLSRTAGSCLVVFAAQVHNYSIRLALQQIRLRSPQRSRFVRNSRFCLGVRRLRVSTSDCDSLLACLEPFTVSGGLQQ